MNKNINLINARKAKNLTQEQLAEKIQCQKTTISNWENGYSKPTLDVAYVVSEILETNINILFFAEKVQETQINNRVNSKP
ncbi:helix-turn-helix transcriptional regulator [Mesobacillus subterraneus]|uniref:XRE family transcriptional regulator n=1 Tax=Mesobacillus subterraneus TaxID=285983 RepID=A0A3R9DZC0_9BACI|nr:helix-turn-helix transcriptional regulator [Mesobacillus subterraneus]RSD21054.1 XRE family transcriptional regulator [Mesobacillus subterraneus]